MTPHLSSDDQLAALDGTLSADRAAHVADCTSCQEALTRTRAIVEAVRRDDVPEPSPLFWDHFSARVRAATASEPVVASARFGWRVWVTVGSAVAAFALVLVMREGNLVPGQSVPQTAQVAPGASPVVPADRDEAEPLAAVMQMASSLSSEDLSGVVSAAGDGTPLVEDLSPAERAAFVRLLHAEMEKVQ